MLENNAGLGFFMSLAYMSMLKAKVKLVVELVSARMSKTRFHFGDLQWGII